MSFSKSPFIILSLSIMMTSTIMAMSSSNWLFLWTAMELNLLSFIPLLMNSKKYQETEAAIKYFLAQALGSSIMLMSSMSLWFNLSFPNNLMTIILSMSLLIKLGMVPCHVWYPSVMTSISWLSCLILSTWQKLAPLMILSFLMIGVPPHFMMFIASINALVGGLMGMNQTHLRTIMAYSSITHMGWMTSLLSIHKPLITTSYFIMYSLIITPLFMIFHMKTLMLSPSMNKIMLQSPSLQMIVPMLLLSLGGLPPLTGFIPKWMTISSLSAINPILTIMLIMGAMMNTYYYLNILFNFFMSHLTFKKSIFSPSQSPMKLMTLVAISSLMMFPLVFMM